MSRNPLREALNAGRPTVGTHILSAWPTLVELIGHSKQYDYVEFTAEYAPFTMHDLDNLGRSFELMGMSGMIKIEQTQYTHQAMRAIGSGFQSVLFADIRSVEDAKAAVDAVRAETTMAEGARGRGRLGVGMRRDVGTVRTGGSPAYVDALNEVVIAIMVEKKSCVDDLDAVLSVPGLDMVQFGASDYSMSIGLTGQANHLGATIQADIVKQKLPTNNGGYAALNAGGSSYGKWDKRVYTQLCGSDEAGHGGHPIDLCRYQVLNNFMGRVPLINSGGESKGAGDLQEAVATAVINKRAGGMGLISGRKAFQKPMREGVALLQAVQDVYLDKTVTVA